MGIHSNGNQANLLDEDLQPVTSFVLHVFLFLRICFVYLPAYSMNLHRKTNQCNITCMHDTLNLYADNYANIT